jgi:hypothetical protein
MKEYEYKFIKVGAAIGFLRPSIEMKYRPTIEEHAKMGWRLVQIFTPTSILGGGPAFYEIILEREIESPGKPG